MHAEASPTTRTVLATVYFAMGVVLWSAVFLAFASVAAHAGFNPPAGDVRVLYAFSSGAQAAAGGSNGRWTVANNVTNWLNQVLANTPGFQNRGAKFVTAGVHTEAWDDGRHLDEWFNFLSPSSGSLHPYLNSLRRNSGVRADLILGFSSTTRSSGGDGKARLNASCGSPVAVAKISGYGGVRHVPEHEALHVLAATHEASKCNPNGPSDISSPLSSSCPGTYRARVLSGAHTYQGWSMGDGYSRNNAWSVANKWGYIAGCVAGN
jgi:hypothetical protein